MPDNEEDLMDYLSPSLEKMKTMSHNLSLEEKIDLIDFLITLIKMDMIEKETLEKMKKE